MLHHTADFEQFYSSEAEEFRASLPGSPPFTHSSKIMITIFMSVRDLLFKKELNSTFLTF